MTPLAQAPVLAFDLGGTRLKAGIARDGHIGDQVAVDIEGDPAAAVIAHGRRFLARTACAAVGLCVPGLVDDGVLVSLPGKHAGLEGTDLRAMLTGAFGVPAFVSNDAIAYAVGEAVAGAARGHHRAAVMTVGTGIGVGVIEDGRPLGAGPLGGGQLGGQIPIAETSDQVDSNGQRGTIEALCAASRLLTADAAGAHADVPGLLVAARRGEPMATAAVEQWRSHFVRAVVAIAHAHTPSVIVVGGGPLADDAILLDGVEEAANQRLFGSYRVAVRRAELGDAAALHGIAHLARSAA